MNKLLTFFLILQLLSCQSSTPTHSSFNHRVKTNQCDEAANQIPIDASLSTFLEDTARIGTTIGSYALSLSALTVGTFVGLMGNHPEYGLSLAITTHEGTLRMRCPKVDDVSEKIRLFLLQ